MRPRDVFWNPTQRRLRAPWRVPLQVALLVVLGAVGGVALRTAGLFGALQVASVGPAASVVGIVFTGSVAFLGIWLGSNVLDRRPFRDYGFDVDAGWWRDLGFGLALGAGLMTSIFVVELAAGWITVTGTLRAPRAVSVWAGVGAAVVAYLAVGLYEELVMRGYLLRNVAEGLVFFERVSAATALVAASVVSALVFGVAHALNPAASVASTLGIAAAGVFLAVGYVLTGELALPVGVHVSWNVFQGPVFGFPVSGNAPAASLVAVRQDGPRLVTGGAFGPEAGLLGVAASVAGVAAVAWWVRREEGTVVLRDRLVMPALRWRE
jgi:membrane protease YdiL (CAAX protease family)